MSMRFWISAVLGLGLAAGLMTAAAYGTASPQVPATLNVVSADFALLAVIPGYGQANDGLIAHIDDPGLFWLDFRKGAFENVAFGFQPDSTYFFRDLFIIENNGNTRQWITADILREGSLAPPAEAVELTADVEGVTYLISGPGATPAPLDPGNALFVSVQFQVQAWAVQGPRDYVLRVHGQQGP